MSNRLRPTVMLVVLALAFTALGIWFGNRADDAREEEIGPAAVAPGEPGKRTELTQSESSRSRAGIAAPDAQPAKPAGASQPDASAAALPHVHGRVVDLRGQGVANQEITALHAPLVVFARSRGDGSFEFDGAPGDASLVASSAEYATVRALPPGFMSARGDMIVVAPVVAVSGVVVDEAGLGIPGAHVASIAGEPVLAHFPLPLDTTIGVDAPEAVCDGGGAFTLERCISASGAHVRASFRGLDSVSVPAPSTPRSDLHFVLKKSGTDERVVTGIVVRANGDAATTAHVHIGEAETATDAHGAFRMPLPDWLPDEQALVAIESGSQAAILAAFGERARTAGRNLEPVRLVLGPPPLSIAGHVRDSKGHALKDWVVTLAHGTPVSVGRVPPITAEGLTTGEETLPRSGEDGAFRIDGLLDREYELVAWNDESLARIESKPIRSGTHDAELVLDAGAFEPKVTGRVLAKDGTPIAGADVSVGLVTGRAEGATSWISGKSTTTNADGSFEFVDVPRHFAHFNVGGDQVIPLTFPLEGVELALPIRIEVARRCHFRVEGLPASSAPRWIAAKDADGQELQIMAFQAGGWSSTNRQEASTDATRVYGVSEEAVDLVLIGTDNRPSDKRPLRLVPGEVTVVKW